MQDVNARKIYDFHSSFYDITFGRLVRRGIARAISHIPMGDDIRVLDIGIGTGVSLDYYPKDRGTIIGIDLSPGMLANAKKRVESKGWANARLLRADAMDLPFADDAFDHVFISHVISVVSDPVRLVAEAQRVARQGAKIVIVNHFLSTHPLVARFEKWINPLCLRLGWKSDLSLQGLLRRTGAQIDYRYKLSAFDLMQTVVILNDKSAVNRKSAALAAA